VDVETPCDSMVRCSSHDIAKTGRARTQLKLMPDHSRFTEYSQCPVSRGIRID
jgi:hypothetical protein